MDAVKLEGAWGWRGGEGGCGRRARVGRGGEGAGEGGARGVAGGGVGWQEVGWGGVEVLGATRGGKGAKPEVLTAGVGRVTDVGGRANRGPAACELEGPAVGAAWIASAVHGPSHAMPRHGLLSPQFPLSQPTLPLRWLPRHTHPTTTPTTIATPTPDPAGGSPARVEAARAIVETGVAVMGHVGLTPQSVSVIGEAEGRAGRGRGRGLGRRSPSRLAYASGLLLIHSLAFKRYKQAP